MSRGLSKYAIWTPRRALRPRSPLPLHRRMPARFPLSPGIGFWEHHDHFSFTRGGCEFDSIGFAFTDNRTEIAPIYPLWAIHARMQGKANIHNEHEEGSSTCRAPSQ